MNNIVIVLLFLVFAGCAVVQPTDPYVSADVPPRDSSAGPPSFSATYAL